MSQKNKDAAVTGTTFVTLFGLLEEFQLTMNFSGYVELCPFSSSVASLLSDVCMVCDNMLKDISIPESVSGPHVVGRF